MRTDDRAFGILHEPSNDQTRPALPTLSPDRYCYSMAPSLQQEPQVDLSLALEHGLTEEEYRWIVAKLGRDPSYVELGIYAVMWSEHCSYKNSIALLKTLPREGGALLVEGGEENAGLVDVGEGLGVAFKIESHNHPSAVEPYQGAATGVGGIQRDIFTMGARPICSLNSLRLGPLESSRVRYLLDGIVRGIGDYGNSFGVPTVAGEVYFDESYEGNPLVNAMSVGLVKADETASAIAVGVGNPVFIVGAATGRDGIHGATFASEELSEESDAKRPNVQVGDPFTEKLLLEATLEAIASGTVVGIQDMGAAGITCSTCEMSAKGASGMIIHVDRVPVREEGMTPYEIMLSESQERMLIVCEKGSETELTAIFEKWDLHVEHIGEVTDDEHVRVMWHGEEVAAVPADHLVLGGGAPVYHRETQRPGYLDETSAFDVASVDDIAPSDVQGALTTLLGAPNIASKAWVFNQFDTTVRTNTIVGPGAGDAAVVRIKGSDRALAVSVDCNARHVYLNPRRGAQAAVAEAARNVVCAGGKPLAITNCLNFGNPYNPEVYWTFSEAIAGMGEACRLFDTPVTGGNVSFYNENRDGPIFPTPTIGMLGLVDSLTHITPSGFQQARDVVFLISPKNWAYRDDLGGSEYLATLMGRTTGDAPHLDLVEELAVQTSVLDAIRAGLIRSAHDVSDGGLLVCLAEKAVFSDGLGADLNIDETGARLDASLFGESHSRIVVTVSREDVSEFEVRLRGSDVRATRLGEVTEGRLHLDVDGDRVVDAVVSGLASTYNATLPGFMDA